MDTIQSLKRQIQLLQSEVQELKKSQNSNKVISHKQLGYKDSQIRFRTIFECSRLANKVISSDFKILEVNPAFVNLLGYSKAELLGNKILDYSPAEHQADWQLLQEKLWNGSTPAFNLETCLKKKDGSLIWCNINSILFEDNGQTLGYTILEDISIKREMRLYRDDFLNLASHELKTPVTSLKAVVQVMNRMIDKHTDIPQKIVQLAIDADRYIIKLTHLINDLLNSTKVSGDNLTLNKTSFTVGQLIEDCCKHITLKGTHHVDCFGDLSTPLFADKQKIDQVLVNLINNAVKYAPDDLAIDVQVEDLNDSLKISISDRGCGISPEHVPYLFEKYYRVNKSGNQGSGIGLGLYICAEIIKSHKGVIGVESTLNEGTTFWFTLPK
ncbi:sensor histidine kinase [Desertivirga xinjiangensis]|uniref:sensor histidine kinase n=1 Tax=Desertivirga xinjiangensis TaxID=539206 RepID=UPI00210EE822|nr:PAS domain-containing sensor histidine kinase [Pedobacter xinjiangensis]